MEESNPMVLPAPSVRRNRKGTVSTPIIRWKPDSSPVSN